MVVDPLRIIRCVIQHDVDDSEKFVLRANVAHCLVDLVKFLLLAKHADRVRVVVVLL